MNNTRTSIIWTISKEEFIEKVEKSNSLPDLLESFGFSRQGGASYKTIYKRITEEGLDLATVKERWLNNCKSKLVKLVAQPLTEILIENSTYNSYSLRKRLIEEKILDNKCFLCGIDNVWNGKPISLQLDHINGIRTDQRLENLRLLCPNCHSQTETWGVGNKKKKEKIYKPRKRKVEWPSKEQLEEEVNRKVSFVSLGEKYGVSDNAVRKWCKYYKIGRWKNEGLM